MERISAYPVGSRLLINDNFTSVINPTEVDVLEFSPSKKLVKLHSIIPDTTYWEEVEDKRVLEELPKRRKGKKK